MSNFGIDHAQIYNAKALSNIQIFIRHNGSICHMDDIRSVVDTRTNVLAF